MSVNELVGLVSTNSTLLVPLLQAEDPETCRLLGPFALVVQGLMAVLVLGSLVIKRTREKPRRKWKIWICDLAKQIIGQMFLHGSNVLVASAISAHKGDNPCAGYAINIIVDTTFGVFVMWACLRLSTMLVHHFDPTYRTGFYGEPFSFTAWARQCGVYVGCMVVMKAVVVATFWMFPWMFTFANWALSWIQSDEAQLIIVMLIVPTVMNIVQFLILDSILRFASPEAASEADSAEREFLFEDDQDDDFSDDEESAVGRRGRRASSDAESRHKAQKMDGGLEPVRAEVVLARSGSTGIGSGSSGSGSSSVVVDGFSYPPPSITITAPGARSRQGSASSSHHPAVSEPRASTPPPAPTTPSPAPAPAPAPVLAHTPSFALAHAAPQAEEDESFDDDWGFDDPEPDEEAYVSEKVAGAEGGVPPVAQFSY